MKIADAAERVLAEANSALELGELRKRIEEQGLFQFRAKDPEAVLAKALRKDERFERKGPRVFGLA